MEALDILRALAERSPLQGLAEARAVDRALVELGAALADREAIKAELDRLSKFEKPKEGQSFGQAYAVEMAKRHGPSMRIDPDAPLKATLVDEEQAPESMAQSVDMARVVAENATAKAENAIVRAQGKPPASQPVKE